MNYTDTTLKEIQLSRYIHVTKNVKQRNLHKLHTLVPKGSPMKEQLQQLFPWDRHITRRKKTQSWWGLLECSVMFLWGKANKSDFMESHPVNVLSTLNVLV